MGLLCLTVVKLEFYTTIFYVAGKYNFVSVFYFGVLTFYKAALELNDLPCYCYSFQYIFAEYSDVSCKMLYFAYFLENYFISFLI